MNNFMQNGFLDKPKNEIIQNQIQYFAIQNTGF